MTNDGHEQFLDADKVLGGEEEQKDFSKPRLSEVIVPSNVRMASTPIAPKWGRQPIATSTPVEAEACDEDESESEPEEMEEIVVEDDAAQSSATEDVATASEVPEVADSVDVAAADSISVADAPGDAVAAKAAAGAPSAADAAPKGGEIAVEILKDEDRITALKITCPCGRHTRLNVEYAKGSSTP